MTELSHMTSHLSRFIQRERMHFFNLVVGLVRMVAELREADDQLVHMGLVLQDETLLLLDFLALSHVACLWFYFCALFPFLIESDT